MLLWTALDGATMSQRTRASNVKLPQGRIVSSNWVDVSHALHAVGGGMLAAADAMRIVRQQVWDVSGVEFVSESPSAVARMDLCYVL